MSDDLDAMGPIDYLVIEFPGSRMTGEGVPLLVDLVDRGIIRILDLLFVRKELDGSVSGVAIADFDPTANSISPCSRVPRPASSTPRTSTTPVPYWSRVARPSAEPAWSSPGASRPDEAPSNTASRVAVAGEVGDR